MANTFLTSSLISKEAAALFRVHNSFLATGNRRYEGMFNENTYKPGDTINVRLDNFFEGQRGDSVVAEDITEASIPVTIQPLFSVPILYTPTDLQRKIADFSDEVLMPAVRRLSAMMNKAIWDAGLTQITNIAGDPAANLNTFASLDDVNPIMDDLAIDPVYNRYASIAPKEVQQLRSAASLQNSFVSPINKEITMDAMLGRLADFDIYKDQSVTKFTAGTHAGPGSVTVNAAVSSGNTIVLTGLTDGTTFVPGDIITIAGVFGWNPILRQKTELNKTYTVTNNETVAGGNATLTVSETIQFTGSRKNVFADGGDTEIPAGAVVTLYDDHVANYCYSEKGLITCMPPLQPMDSPHSSVATDRDYGISVRVSKSAEVLENRNVLRLDAQLATTWVPNQAVRLISKGY